MTPSSVIGNHTVAEPSGASSHDRARSCDNSADSRRAHRQPADSHLAALGLRLVAARLIPACDLPSDRDVPSRDSRRWPTWQFAAKAHAAPLGPVRTRETWRSCTALGFDHCVPAAPQCHHRPPGRGQRRCAAATLVLPRCRLDRYETCCRPARRRANSDLPRPDWDGETWSSLKKSHSVEKPTTQTPASYHCPPRDAAPR